MTYENNQMFMNSKWIKQKKWGFDFKVVIQFIAFEYLVKNII